jgi:hypothetical protein
MLMSMPSTAILVRATENIRVGSVIEYEYSTDSIGIKTSRALALVTEVHRTPNVARSKLQVISPAPKQGDKLLMSKVTAVVII